MRKIIAFIICYIITGLAYSQSRVDANLWFSNYEYSKAAKAFEQINNKSGLTGEDYKKWCYSNFIIGDYEKSYKMADSIMKGYHPDSYFSYVKGFSALAIQKYKEAEKSFKVYKKLEPDYPIDSLIASSQQIPTWDTMDIIGINNFNLNAESADISGTSYKEGIIIYQEFGRVIDSFKYDRKQFRSIQDLMFMKPLMYFPKEKKKSFFNFTSDFDNFSFTSATIDASTDSIYLTLTNPIAKDMFLRSPHIYVGYLDENDSILDLKLWNFSGEYDTTSTAHATINPSNTMMVFTKFGENTQQSDLYYSLKENGQWTTPVAYSELNSVKDEMFPVFINDSLLAFSSNGRVGYGNLDIYIAHLDKKSVKSIEHLKRPINSFKDDFNYTKLGDSLLFFSSNRQQGKGDDDIYIVKLKYSKIIPAPIIKKWNNLIAYFDFDKSELRDTVISQLKNIDFTDYITDTTQFIIVGHTDNRGTNKYNYKLASQRSTSMKDKLIDLGVPKDKIRVIAKGEITPQVVCSTCTEKEHQKNRFVEVYLKRGNSLSNSELFNTINFDTELIYFDFDKYSLNAIEKEKIDAIILPQIIGNKSLKKIKIIGYTDQRGNASYNLKLGMSRSQSIKNYLINNNVASELIEIQSSGENNPKIKCDGGCSEQQYQLNRFCEIILINQ